MDIIEKSLQIALDAYKGQTDKAGKSYILHPLRVMQKMDSIEEMAVALLHDVIEDSAYTPENLLEEGIPASVVDAVLALTKNDNETYDQFIDRVLTNKIASKVKIADIEDNINILRLTSVDDKDLARIAKYHRSWHKLQNGTIQE